MNHEARTGSALLLAALLAPGAGAQTCENFGPVTADFRVNAGAGFDQIWGRVARDASGFTFAWSAGQDVWARRFDANLVPQGSDFQVNTTLTVDIQDEPEVAYSTAGTRLIAWSDRNANDGELMGVFGRVYNAAGSPIAPEFQINVAGAASQWRPLIAPAPNGQFVVAWSGDWDGDSFFRILNSNGGGVSGDVRVNTWEFDAQVDPAPGVNANGNVFVAFVDFSGHGSVGTGLNLYGRTFTGAGVPREASEFAITSTTGNGDQREPRIAADGLGRFIVVWETQIHDGSGYGIYARRYSDAGLPLGAEFRVNTTTSGNQRSAAIAVEQDGGFLVTWLDWSTGGARIAGQRFDSAANAIGAEFIANENPASGVDRPSIAATPTGDDVVIAYSGPGNASDVYARRFVVSGRPLEYGTPKMHSAGCLPWIGSVGTASASDPAAFSITASNVLNQATGGLYYSFNSAFTPFLGGTLYLGWPMYRTTNFFSRGNPLPLDCSGSFTYNFNALIQGGLNPALSPGSTVSVQYVFRDVNDPAGFGRGMTNALRFTICP